MHGISMRTSPRCRCQDRFCFRRGAQTISTDVKLPITTRGRVCMPPPSSKRAERERGDRGREDDDDDYCLKQVDGWEVSIDRSVLRLSVQYYHYHRGIPNDEEAAEKRHQQH